LRRLLQLTQVHEIALKSPVNEIVEAIVAGPTSGVATNHDLEGLASVLNGHSSITEADVDVTGSTGRQSYPALTNLLQSDLASINVSLRRSPFALNAGYICRGLESLSKKLKTLGLAFHRTTTDNREEIAVIEREIGRCFRSLHANETLATLYVRVDHAIDVQPCARAVQDFLRSNRALERLELRFENVREDGRTLVLVRALVSLVVNRSLRELSMSTCDVPDGFLPALVDVLEDNGVFGELDGPKFPADHPALEKANFLMKQNRFGRRFLLEPGLAPVGIWAHIFAKASKASEADVVYQFLRTRPTLVQRRGVRRSRAPRENEGHDDDAESD
jgi:hypothetical protein